VTVGITTRLRAGWFGVQIPVGREIFLFSKASRLALGLASLLFSWYLGSFPGVEMAGA
jgi:hypothetical protein